VKSHSADGAVPEEKIYPTAEGFVYNGADSDSQNGNPWMIAITVAVVVKEVR
jgi:hypothetical protein